MTEPLLLKPHTKDLGGGFVVRRSLPALHQQAVGPFVFFDHFGPITAQPSDHHDVRPHPHIGLATVTFLWSGGLRHRDTLGSLQDILPGDVNWMTAGRGIAHSERTPPNLRDAGGLRLRISLRTRALEPSRYVVLGIGARRALDAAGRCGVLDALAHVERSR